MENGSLSHTDEYHIVSSSDSRRRHGGWITFPFIIGATLGLTLAVGGWLSNLIVFLIQEFNEKSIDAAQIANVVDGSSSFFPVLGAIIADSFFGPFLVISISSCISLLGIVLLILTVTFDSLKPQPCVMGSEICQSTSFWQYTILYTGVTLASLGIGGTRFTLATFGANQFDNPKHQATFFNWFFISIYSTSTLAITVIVYMEDNLGFKWGFGLAVAANVIGMVIFLSGTRYYRHSKPQGSPFAGLTRVVVATTRKWNLQLSSESKDYCYYGEEGETNGVATTPSGSFSFLNRAAQKVEGDVKPDGTIAKPWKLCTVQQVEDFKTLVRIMPLWSTSIFLGTPIGIQGSLTVLQALTMDGHLGPHFQIPAGSVMVVLLLSNIIFLALIDRVLCPMWQKLTGHFPTPLQRIGLGHVLKVLAMAVSALVESKRLKISQDHPGATTVPMLAMWLFPQLALAGIGEAFHFPGQVTLYYQEFPSSLKSTATVMISLVIGISFYLGTGLIKMVQRVTRWLPDNINDGKLENVYWMLVIIGVVNFGYYLVCARLYRYQNVKDTNDSSDG
ncbi:PREDICTED: protein NRT1/ PTR FAMILY 2.7-like [Fragaria vesca subsp. vesca]|uniref:protein NRT1/ PTR FAMILY 2.7-like n=1 Tax=Fragaria vesca subsp. vesca TaxID=101020 RepID=UPI0002C352E3|nr:PREDICTED: protein NRT1/ PTR FAMILY 2.7-like [Fragaria vesca subsp. vesca]